MSELLPCPFCGGVARAFKRTCDKDTRYDPADRAFPIVRCGACGACSEGDDWTELQIAIDRWNRRAQPAQAVPASCGECGKKASDGWALYCVACMEKAGLPAVTDSPPLTHSCTSSLSKTPNSTAQAVPQWLPISTAPKDGTRVLLVIDHGEWGDAVWTGLWADGWMVSYGKAQATPTHWMPLPPPTGIVGEKGGA